MTEKEASIEEHKKLAINLFNLTWSLLDKKDRTREENDKMVHAAHATMLAKGTFKFVRNNVKQSFSQGGVD